MPRFALTLTPGLTLTLTLNRQLNVSRFALTQPHPLTRQLRVPRFACGGGGSLLSAEAVRRMDLASCTAYLHANCMQSDWMIGGCARQHNVSLLRELGCSTCDPRRVDHVAVQRRLSRDQCFFMQNAHEFAQAMPLGAHSPAIVHGLPNEMMVRSVSSM